MRDSEEERVGRAGGWPRPAAPRPCSLPASSSGRFRRGPEAILPEAWGQTCPEPGPEGGSAAGSPSRGSAEDRAVGRPFWREAQPAPAFATPGSQAGPTRGGEAVPRATAGVAQQRGDRTRPCLPLPACPHTDVSSLGQVSSFCAGVVLCGRPGVTPGDGTNSRGLRPSLVLSVVPVWTSVLRPGSS